MLVQRPKQQLVILIRYVHINWIKTNRETKNFFFFFLIDCDIYFHFGSNFLRKGSDTWVSGALFIFVLSFKSTLKKKKRKRKGTRRRERWGAGIQE